MSKELFIKFLQRTCSEEEFEQVSSWIRNEALDSNEKKKIIDVWNEFEPEFEPSKADKLRYRQVLDRIHHQINITALTPQNPDERKLSYTHILTILTRVAAVLLLPSLFLLFYTNRPVKNQFAENVNDLEVIAPEGSKMHLQLGDGTKVWLNNGSKLKYPIRFTGDMRKVYLSGEGYFEVTHNKDIPFLVTTDHLTVKATGTTFNVNAYPDDDHVETTLIEGKVILFDSSLEKEIRQVQPDECVSFEYKKNRYLVETATVQKNIAWKDGLLIFKRDSISNVAKKLERRYNIDVEITNKNVKRFTYTATFADEPLPQVLELLSLATPLSYKVIQRQKLADGSYTRQKVLIGLKIK